MQKAKWLPKRKGKSSLRVRSLPKAIAIVLRFSIELILVLRSSLLSSLISIMTGYELIDLKNFEI